ncbi:SAV_2336 N-terminal domain-related protein [Limnoraphis robusta]|uniref:SAV_2336 N-terminal domain-related protein n=1 Tax=Limnoraphis robusta TaxID=1118279 RepID=UPI0038991668
MNEFSCHRAIERLLSHLELSGLIERLELSDEDIIDAIWLALQMGVVEPKIPKEQPNHSQNSSQKNPPSKTNSSSPSTSEKQQTQTESTFNLYSQDPSPPGKSENETGAESSPFQAPAAPALQNKLSIGRALRPLMRKVPSTMRTILDAEATVTRIVEQNIWLPVAQPEPERWLDLELVVEESRSSFIWTETIDEFQKLLENQGAFRTLRAWNLSSTETQQLQLTRRKKDGQKSRCQHHYRELIHSNGRGLILVVSDCVSGIWKQKTIYRWLQNWSQKVPTAIVQLFPERLWQSSQLGFGYKLPLGAFNPGVPNSDLVLPSLWAEIKEEEDIKERQILKLPVVTLEASSLAKWAKVIAGCGNTETPGFVLDLDFVSEQIEAAETDEPQKVSPENLVDRFLATASPTAQRLAGLMAAAPVSLPVINLIQKIFLPNQSTPVNVAEVFLSGMIRRTNVLENNEPPQYDFVPKVRKLLNRAIHLEKTEEVLDVVSRYVAENLDSSIKDFPAFLSKYKNLTGSEQEKLLPFAQVAAEVLENLGREYAVFAEELRNQSRSNTIENFPPLQTLEFKIATVSIEDEPSTPSGINLKPFKFQVARIEKVNPSTPSNPEDLIKILDGEVFQKTGQHLNEPQQLILKGTFANQTYNEIAGSTPHSRNSLLRVGRKLWKILSEVLGETVNKNNARQVIERWDSQPSLRIHFDDRQNQYFTEDCNGVELEMVQIPGGTFLMGSPKNEPERHEDESPQHEVTVSEFFMGKYPVTQAQWRAIATSVPKIQRDLNPYPSTFKGDNRPVESVSWYDAVEFCARLSRYTGQVYRLPSEAEWEYACRAGTTTPFHFGETITTDLANYNGNYTYGEGLEGQYRDETTPVGSFQVANAFGLYDMHGNVWEWCADPWHNNYEGNARNGQVWDEKNGDGFYQRFDNDFLINALEDDRPRVRRGGSWNDNPGSCRSAYRIDTFPGNVDDYNGFRVVCVPPRT